VLRDGAGQDSLHAGESLARVCRHSLPW
jgi:hypothetical protein